MPSRNKSSKSVSGSGSIRKKTVTKPNGKEYTFWEGRVTVGIDPKTGKQKQRSVSGKTQKEVAQKIRQLTTEVDQGVYVEPVKMTVGEWLDVWLDEYLGDIKPRTIDSYESAVKTHLKPAFGKKKLAAIQASDIQHFYTALQRQKKPLSGKTIRNIHGVLHKAMQQAVDLGYLHKNPSDPCRLPRAERPPIRPLDDDAIQAFLRVAKGHHFENLYLVTLFTGMREGEVIGLKWDCIDWNAGTILIKQQLQRKRGGKAEYILCSPKNGKYRKVTPAPYIMDVLREQKEMQNEWRAAAGEMWENSNFVFTNELGHHLSPLSVYKEFKTLITEAGYPETRFHDLRHSYAVASLQNGDDIKTVQENLGHHTAAFTLDVYGHVTQKMRKDSADRMQRYIDSIREKNG